MCDEVWVPQNAVSDVLREYGDNGKISVVVNGNEYA